MLFLLTCRSPQRSATGRHPVQRVELAADATWPPIAVAAAYQRQHPAIEVIGCEVAEGQP